jgi:malate dehydrogenase (oxaloacetate-decarboxylating)
MTLTVITNTEDENSKGFSGKTLIFRIQMDDDWTRFSLIASVVSQARGEIVAVDMAGKNQSSIFVDLTIRLGDLQETKLIEDQLNQIQGISIVNVSDRTFLLHLGGKLTIQPKAAIQNRDDLSRVYTPDVARVCMAIYEDPAKAYNLTIKRNTVAVISDGSAVLGLGNIGACAAMPVMEGKAVLFKQFADVDAFPICLDTQDTEEIIRIVKSIAPAFGGVNLEDISSPRCFDIEERLRRELDIPVFHDDQHGTAVVLYAGLINALKVTKKKLTDIKVVIAGVGAAGVACGKILLAAGVKDVIGFDRQGIVTRDSQQDHPIKQWFANHSNPRNIKGTLSDALDGADVFIGLSSAGILTRSDVERMNDQPIVFALANPVPEIMPELIEDIAGVIATGRSDYPNQINNVLCFPSIFRGALDCRATTINEEMKLAAAEAIASIVSDDEVNRHYIIPSVFNKKIMPVVREKVIQAAIHSKVAQKVPKE